MKKIIFSLIVSASVAIYAAHGNNHRLAGDIVFGISEILKPAPVVVTPPAPVVVTQPVVTTPVVTAPVVQPVVTTPVIQPVVPQPIPTYGYAMFNGISCPTYDGYYYYNNTWVWGGGPILHRPPVPLWRPHPRPMMHGPVPPRHPIIHRR